MESLETENGGVKPFNTADVFPVTIRFTGENFEKSEDIARKIVVSTNMAKTSLTIDGIKYVMIVDSSN